MSTEDSSKAIGTYLKEHPRAMGALFALVLLLTQAAPVVARNSATTGGP